MAGFEDIEEMLDGLRTGAEGAESPVADLTSTLDGLASSLVKSATGFDMAAGRFRNASGQFQSSTDAMSGIAQSSMVKIGNAGKDAAGAIKDLGSVVKTLASGDLPNAKQAMAAVGSALGGVVTSGANTAAEALGKLGPEGEAAGAALQGFAAVLSATIGLMTQFMGMAIEGAQKADLLRDSFAGLAGSTAGGAAIQSMIGKLNLPFATSQVNAWAAALVGAGVSGKQLESELKAIAAAQALTEAFGGQGGAAAEKFFKQMGAGGKEADELLKKIQQGGRRGSETLKDMGLNIADLGGQAAVAKMTAQELTEAVTKALQKKGKGPLEDMALTLPSILQKAREGFMSLFNGAGPAVKAFMTAVKSLFGEFNKGSPLIKDLKPIVTGVLTTLFGWATKAASAIHDLFTWFRNSGKEGGVFSGVVGVMKATWATLVTIFNVVKTALSPIITLFKGIFANAMVLKGLKTIFTVIAVVIGAVVATIATLIAIFAVVAGAVAGFAGLVVGAFSGVVGEVASAIGGIVDAMANFDIGAFVSKMGDMARAGLAAFKNVLGIASPSAVLMEHGEDDVAGGAAIGVDKGQKKVKASAARMGEAMKPEKGKGKGGAAKGEGGGEGGPSFEFNNCNFVGTDESSVRVLLAKVWAEMAAASGAKPAGAT